MFRFLFLTLFPVVLGFDLGLISVSDECEESDVLLILNTTFGLEVDVPLSTVINAEACDFQDGKKYCTYDFTPIHDDYEKICTKVRGFYA